MYACYSARIHILSATTFFKERAIRDTSHLLTNHDKENDQ